MLSFWQFSVDFDFELDSQITTGIVAEVSWFFKALP